MSLLDWLVRLAVVKSGEPFSQVGHEPQQDPRFRCAHTLDLPSRRKMPDLRG
jgi:hypothetical protein